MQQTGFFLQADRTAARTQDVAAGPGVSFAVRIVPTTPEGECERQPVATARVLLAYAGRVDNRREIADRLGRPELARAADGAVLAAAYEAWGPAFAGRVLGEYSFALLDRRTGDVVAGRDSLGARRLYCCERADSVCFASDLGMLLERLPAAPGLCPDGLAEYLATCGLMGSGRTVFAGVREVPPAHSAVLTGERLSLTRTWAPDPHREIRYARPEEYEEALRALLFDAVRGALRCNGPVWSDLSGGLDSSTVTAVAALLARAGEGPGHGLAAFSMRASKTPESDEGAFQRELLALHPMPQHLFDTDVHREFEVDAGERSCRPLTGILWSPGNRKMRAIFAAHGVRVRLTGLGGDQVFCGDDFPPVHLAEWLRTGRWGTWLRGVREWAGAGRRTLWSLLRSYSLGVLPDEYRSEERVPVPEWLAGDMKGRLAELRPGLGTSGERHFASPAREMHYRQIVRSHTLLDYSEDPCETRHPLLYRPLVEFMLAVPWECKVNAREDRVLQRRALRGVLPEAIRSRGDKTQGMSRILRGLVENWDRARALAQGRNLAGLGIVDPAAFRSACERFRHGCFGKHFPHLLAALSLEAWLGQREEGGVAGAGATGGAGALPLPAACGGASQLQSTRLSPA